MSGCSAAAPVAHPSEHVHELSITSHLLAMIEQEAANVRARRVVDINLVIGERTNVVDDSLRFCFEVLAADTVAEGARVHIQRSPSRFRCARDGDYTPTPHDFRCPRCQEVGTMTEAGSELLVESIEVET